MLLGVAASMEPPVHKAEITTLAEGGNAKIVSDSAGLPQNDVVNVLTIDRDGVTVVDADGRKHTVQKSDLQSQIQQDELETRGLGMFTKQYRVLMGKRSQVERMLTIHWRNHTITHFSYKYKNDTKKKCFHIKKITKEGEDHVLLHLTSVTKTGWTKDRTMKLEGESIDFLKKCKEYSVPMATGLLEQELRGVSVTLKGDYAHAALNGRIICGECMGEGKLKTRSENKKCESCGGTGKTTLKPSNETLNAVLKKKFSFGRYASKAIEAMLTPSGNLVHFKLSNGGNTFFIKEVQLPDEDNKVKFKLTSTKKLKWMRNRLMEIKGDDTAGQRFLYFCRRYQVPSAGQWLQDNDKFVKYTKIKARNWEDWQKEHRDCTKTGYYLYNMKTMGPKPAERFTAVAEAEETLLYGRLKETEARNEGRNVEEFPQIKYGEKTDKKYYLKYQHLDTQNQQSAGGAEDHKELEVVTKTCRPYWTGGKANFQNILDNPNLSSMPKARRGSTIVLVGSWAYRYPECGVGAKINDGKLVEEISPPTVSVYKEKLMAMDSAKFSKQIKHLESLTSEPNEVKIVIARKVSHKQDKLTLHVGGRAQGQDGVNVTVSEIHTDGNAIVEKKKGKQVTKEKVRIEHLIPVVEVKLGWCPELISELNVKNGFDFGSGKVSFFSADGSEVKDTNYVYAVTRRGEFKLYPKSLVKKDRETGKETYPKVDKLEGECITIDQYIKQCIDLAEKDSAAKEKRRREQYQAENNHQLRRPSDSMTSTTMPMRHRDRAGPSDSTPIRCNELSSSRAGTEFPRAFKSHEFVAANDIMGRYTGNFRNVILAGKDGDEKSDSMSRRKSNGSQDEKEQSSMAAMLSSSDCSECSGNGTKKDETCTSCSGTGKKATFESMKQQIGAAWIQEGLEIENLEILKQEDEAILMGRNINRHIGHRLTGDIYHNEAGNGSNQSTCTFITEKRIRYLTKKDAAELLGEYVTSKTDLKIIKTHNEEQRVNLGNRFTLDGLTIFHLAVKSLNLKALRYLVKVDKEGCRNLPDNGGNTPYAYAKGALNIKGEYNSTQRKVLVKIRNLLNPGTRKGRTFQMYKPEPVTLSGLCGPPRAAQRIRQRNSSDLSAADQETTNWLKNGDLIRYFDETQNTWIDAKISSGNRVINALLQDGSDGTGEISIAILENVKTGRPERTINVSFEEFYKPEDSPESPSGQFEELYPSTTHHISSSSRVHEVADGLENQDNYLYYKTFGEWDEKLIRSDRNSHFKEFIGLADDSVESTFSRKTQSVSSRTTESAPIARPTPCDRKADGASGCGEMVRPGQERGQKRCGGGHLQARVTIADRRRRLVSRRSENRPIHKLLEEIRRAQAEHANV